MLWCVCGVGGGVVNVLPIRAAGSTYHQAQGKGVKRRLQTRACCVHRTHARPVSGWCALGVTLLTTRAGRSVTPRGWLRLLSCQQSWCGDKGVSVAVLVLTHGGEGRIRVGQRGQHLQRLFTLNGAHSGDVLTVGPPGLAAAHVATKWLSLTVSLRHSALQGWRGPLA